MKKPEFPKVSEAVAKQYAAYQESEYPHGLADYLDTAFTGEINPFVEGDIERIVQYDKDLWEWSKFKTESQRPVYSRPGFSLSPGDWDAGAEGISLIDYFAGQALVGLANHGLPAKTIPELAYNIAEYMIQEKIKRGY